MAMKFDNLQNGDIVVWRDAVPDVGRFSYLNIVRILTMSDFGHVSVAWRRPGEILHVEAVIPKVRMSKLPTNANLYAIPINRTVTDSMMSDYFQKQIGLNYSKRDAFYGLIGKIPKEDDRVQCAELTTGFLKSVGIQLSNSYTPSRLVRRLMEQEGVCLHRLIA